MQTMKHEQVVFCSDKATGLKAIIAIHDTTLGPALGGCRMWPYKNDEAALEDVLRLSRGMTYKAAAAGLSLGGGKAVIIGDPEKIKSQALFRAFGRFVNSLGGRYITAEDVNIKPSDMDYVAMETRSVTGLASVPGGSGDPSPITALGVFYGLKAAVKYKLGKDSLKGLKVAVQGVGSVGSYLCQYLSQEGVELFISDINEEKLAEISKKTGATITALDKIHSADVDVFAPCALGGGLNDETIPQIKAKVIAGGANNQLLEEDKHGQAITDRGILYAPDYVINAGGLISVYQELKGYKLDAVKQKTSEIYDTCLEIFKESEEQNIPTHQASDKIAERRVHAVRNIVRTQVTQFNSSWVKA